MTMQTNKASLSLSVLVLSTNFRPNHAGDSVKGQQENSSSPSFPNQSQLFETLEASF